MTRLTVSFEKSAAKRLTELAEKSDRSKSDVLREALALEEVFQKYSGQGGTFIVRTPDGTEREIIRP
jgi:predicted transcriptional regulator